MTTNHVQRDAEDEWVIEGRVWVFGDNVNTDVIVPGMYLAGGAEGAAKHVMDGIRPGFAELLQPGDVVVGGRNFGTGSSREIAVEALAVAGVAAIIAVSFARIFFRNCINVGLPPVECPGARSLTEGDHVSIDVGTGSIRSSASDEVLSSLAIPPSIKAILRSGGLENHLANRLAT